MNIQNLPRQIFATKLTKERILSQTPPPKKKQVDKKERKQLGKDSKKQPKRIADKMTYLRMRKGHFRRETVLLYINSRTSIIKSMLNI